MEGVFVAAALGFKELGGVLVEGFGELEFGLPNVA